LFCTQDYVPSAPGYCTGPCSKDEDCGDNAYCKQEDQGKGCEPMLCGGTPNDAGVDAHL
jgi:hypothetical protein